MEWNLRRIGSITVEIGIRILRFRLVLLIVTSLHTVEEKINKY